MSPTETRTNSSPERDMTGGPQFDPGRPDLPAVIRAIFDCTRNVTLHQCDPNALDPRRAGRNAPDIVMWTLEADLDGRFVLRRSKASTVHA